VELQVLGEITVRMAGRPIGLGHARQRNVLAALVVDVNRLVEVDRLIDRVWDDHRPRSARRTLSSYVSHLRQALAGDATIEWRKNGYVLTADPEAIDVHRFHRLAHHARTEHDDGRARELADEALGLWRGEAFTGLDSPWIGEVRRTLEHARSALERDRAVRLGRGCGATR
jgi:DNA-binding SARP family transcriptional activator